MYIVVASKYTTLLVLHWLFNYMSLKVMCKYSILLTPSPSRESPTLWQPYWYRLLVTESSTLSMRTSSLEYGAGVGLVSVEPPSLSQGGGAMTELVITDGWFVGEIIDNSESSFVDSINCHFWQLRRSLVRAISCKCFPSREVLLCAVLARACAVYSSILAAQVRVTPTHLPSQMARSISGISALSCDMNLYSVRVELHSSLLWGAGSLLVSTSEAHWPASPNSCMSCCLIITLLVGVMSFNHIQISTLNRLSDLSSSCQMVVGTPSGLCCHEDSINRMSLGVSSLILKHVGFFD